MFAARALSWVKPSATWRPPKSSLTCATVPFTTISPRAMIAMRSHMRSACSITWVENSTVRPSAAIATTMSFITCALTGSRPENGSSRITSSGSCSSAPANCTFCCMPLDRSSTFFCAQSLTPSRSSQACARLRASARPMPLVSPRKIRWSSTFIFLYSPRSSGR